MSKMRRMESPTPSVASSASSTNSRLSSGHGSTYGPLKATVPYGLPSNNNNNSTHSPGYTPMSITPSSSNVEIPAIKIRTKKLSERSESSGKDRRSQLGLRRAGSYDAITSSTYLSGEWPRPGQSLITQAYYSPSNLTIDKSTQTPEEWCNSLTAVDRSSQLNSTVYSSSVSVKQRSPLHTPPALTNDSDSLKEIKQCLSRSSKESYRPASYSLLSGTSLTLPSKPIVVPFLLNRVKTSKHNRDSLEGLNQEVERLVLHKTVSSSNDDLPSHWTPVDGRSGPIAQHLNGGVKGLRGEVGIKGSMRSVTTQTPPEERLGHPPVNPSEERHGYPPVVQARRVEEWLSVPRASAVKQGDSVDEIKLTTSPLSIQHTYQTSPMDDLDYPRDFLDHRLPPEGCERISVKFLERLNHGVSPDRTLDGSLTLKSEVLSSDHGTSNHSLHIPSELSAFNPPPHSKPPYLLPHNSNLTQM